MLVIFRVVGFVRFLGFEGEGEQAVLSQVL
jgi:hypothetical protein